MDEAHIRDIWKVLWHVDVKKDHGNDYDENIVNNLLPNPNYETNNIGTLGTLASDKGWNKENLFNHVVQGDVSIFTHISGTVNIPVTGLTYEYLTIDIPRIPAAFTQVTDFMIGNVALFIDTSNHTDELISDNIIYAYTRATQSDAAEKMNLKTSSAPIYKKNIYFEKAIGQSGVTYPNYTDHSFGLSYFYCKYPVTLIQTDQIDKIIGRLSVEMIYTIPGNPDKTVLVQEGANTAGGARKQKELQKAGFDYSEPTSMKEMVFLSKHHGDIAQVLDIYRPIPLINYTTNKEINSFDYKNCFVSIDINAIIKAFTLGINYVWFYNNRENKLCMFRNRNLNTPENIYQSELAEYQKERIQLISELEEYNSQIDKLNRRHSVFNTVIKRLFTAVSLGDTLNEKYKNELKKGIQIATLSRFVPKNDTNPQVNTTFKETPTPEEIKDMKKLLNNRRSEMNLPIHLLNTQIFNMDPPDDSGDGIELAKTSLENELILQIGRSTWSKKVDSIYSTINIDIDPTRLGFIDSILCRAGSKYNVLWGLDIIQQIYKNLKLYDNSVANNYIDSLITLFIDAVHRTRLLNGLQLINIRPTLFGGKSRYISLTEKKKRRKTSKVKRGGGGELAEYMADLKRVLTFYKELKDMSIINKNSIIESYKQLFHDVFGIPKEWPELHELEKTPEDSTIMMTWPTILIYKDQVDALEGKADITELQGLIDDLLKDDEPIEAVPEASLAPTPVLAVAPSAEDMIEEGSTIVETQPVSYETDEPKSQNVYRGVTARSKARQKVLDNMQKRRVYRGVTARSKARQKRFQEKRITEVPESMDVNINSYSLKTHRLSSPHREQYLME